MEQQSLSLRITIIWTKIVLFVWLGLALGMPFFLHEPTLLIIFYLVFLPILRCIWSMDKLLANIQQKNVFIQQNVEHLRLISWGCFWAALILLGTFWVKTEFILISGVIGFFGLLMRVMKNMLSAAITLKEENDYTI